jgi:hypothetical protein
MAVVQFKNLNIVFKNVVLNTAVFNRAAGEGGLG